MKKGLILIPFASKKSYESGVNLKKSIANGAIDIYLKNCCVACISAKAKSGDMTDVALVTNIKIPNPYNDLLQNNGVKIINAEFDDFDFGGNCLWALAFYKLCALKKAISVTNYDYYSYLDADVFVQSDYSNIWKECEESILMYDICHGLQVEHYRNFLLEIENFRKLTGGGYCAITHYGGEFFAANRRMSVEFISECKKIYDMMLANHIVTKHGDEFIISLAATKLKVKNAGAYVYRFWTGSFRLISTCYKYNPVVVLHVPAEKQYGMLKLYNAYVSKGKLPSNSSVYRLLHLTKRSVRTIVVQLVKKIKG